MIPAHCSNIYLTVKIVYFPALKKLLKIISLDDMLRTLEELSRTLQ